MDGDILKMNGEFKEKLIDCLLLPILYLKGTLDTEKIISGDTSNITLEDGSSSYSDISPIIDLKLSNTTYKRMLFNYDEDTLKDFLSNLIDYRDKNKLFVSLSINIENEDSFINVKIKMDNNYMRIDTIKNNKGISVCIDITVNNLPLIYTIFIVYDQNYKLTSRQKIIELNYSYDPFRDGDQKYSEPYLMATTGDSILIQDLYELENIVVSAYNIDTSKEILYKVCLKRISQLVNKLFANREPMFKHTVPLEDDKISELIKYSVAYEKYSVENENYIFPIANSNRSIFYCSVSVDETTLLDGSYVINLYAIANESITTFKNYITTLENRLQQEITRENCEDAFKSFIEYTKAISRGNYQSYSGRAFLEIYDKEIERWNNKTYTLDEDGSSIILTQQYLNIVQDPWVYYS